MTNEWKLLYGEGTIIVNRENTNEFSIVIASTSDSSPSDFPKCSLTLSINEDKAVLRSSTDSNDLSPDYNPSSFTENSGIESGQIIAYWLSFNRDDRQLKYGKGYVMEQTTCQTYTLKDEVWDDMFAPDKKRYFLIKEENQCGVPANVDIYPYPLTKNWPYLVKDSTTATMSDAANPNFLLSGNLPSTCRELYAVVAPLELDSHLSDAIRNSFNADKYLDTLLKKKNNTDSDGEDDKGMSDYLRITLGNGSDCGSAPRHLELWKSTAKSAIHNHGNAYGVIKVVHGEIDIRIYNKQWEYKSHSCRKPLVTFTARKGDVTWLSPNWYQTHQLQNSSKDYCATIQCYKYGKDDQIMWPYFDYLKPDDESYTIGEFKRGDDADFQKMCAEVLSEYDRSQ